MHLLYIIVTEIKLMAKIKKRDQKIAATKTKRAADDGDTNGSYDFASSDDEEHIDEYVKPTPVTSRKRHKDSTDDEEGGLKETVTPDDNCAETFVMKLLQSTVTPDEPKSRSNMLPSLAHMYNGNDGTLQQSTATNYLLRCQHIMSD